MTAFGLSKWYLDCITDSGETLIGYSGAVEWGAVRLHYSSVLEADARDIAVRHTLREQDEPGAKGDSIVWRSDALQVDGLWRSDSSALRETIFSCEQGSVEWHCLMPRARARCRDRSGLGYVERLLVTIPP